MSHTGVTPIVEFRNIRKEFPGVLALDDVSMKIWPGEVHCLLGENGAGKSTLMKVLTGVYHPDGGEILIEGRKVEVGDIHARSEERRVGKECRL